MNDNNSALALEMALFPFLFPFGTGYFKKKGLTLMFKYLIQIFNEYLHLRFSRILSPFTLCPEYLLIMYQVRQ